MMIAGGKNKKNLNVELNLLPVFDVLSVCICFLLMTVVWVEVRSLETKQMFGNEAALEDSKSSTVWLSIDESNNLTITLKGPTGTKPQGLEIHHLNGSIDFGKAQVALQQAASKKFQMAHILPAKSTEYDQVIKLMDATKKAGILDIGLSPI